MPYNAFSGQKKNTRKNLPGNGLQTVLVKTNDNKKGHLNQIYGINQSNSVV